MDNTAVCDAPIKLTLRYQKEDKGFLIDSSTTISFDDTTTATITIPYSNKIVYLHKTNCPNCGSLLDGDENTPYVRCISCGAKIWSEREVKV